MPSESKYFAFISYSHADEAVATIIHRAIEAINIPREALRFVPEELVNSRKIYPVFRDRDEIPVSPSLPDTLKDFLARSEYLIVICSPSSAKSQWVNAEIEHFIKLGRGTKILSVLVSGIPEYYSEQCPNGAFPPAMKAAVEGIPMAADVSKGKATISRETMRLAAGMLGVSYDMLFRREKRRRRNLISVFSCVMVVLAAPLLYYSVISRREAAEKEAEALQSASFVLAQKSDAAYKDHDYRTAAAIALEGMPDNKRGISLPLSLKAQAALSRSVWQLPNLETVGTGCLGATVKVPKGNGIWCAFAFEQNKQLVIRQPDNSEKTVSLDGHVDRADASKSGGLFALGMEGGLVRVFEDSGNEISSFKAGRGLKSVLFSNNGSYLVTVADSGTVSIWKTDGTLLFEESNLDGQKSASFSDDDSYVAIGAYESGLIYDLKGELQFEAHIPRGSVTSIAFNRHSGRIALGLEDKTVHLWAFDGAEQGILPIPGEWPLRMEFSNDGNSLLVQDIMGASYLWEGTESAIQPSDLSSVYKALVGPDYMPPKFVVNDGSSILYPDGPYLWRKKSQLFRTVDTVYGDVTDFEVRPGGGESVATSSGARTVMLFDANGTLIDDLSGHEQAVWAVRYSPDGKRFITASSDHTARIWDADGKHSVVLDGHTEVVWSAEFSPDGKLAVTSSSDGTSRLWQTDGTLVAVLRGSDFPLGKEAGNLDRDDSFVAPHAPKNWHRAKFSPSGRYILTVSGDNAARLWGSNGQYIATLPASGRVWDASFRQDEGEIVTGSDDGNLQFWNIKGERMEVRKSGRSKVADVKYLGDTKDIFLRDNGSVAKFIYRESNREVVVPQDRESAEFSDASADGKYIVTASFSGLRLWDAEGNELFNISGREAKFTSGTNELAVFGDPTKVISQVPVGQELVEFAKKILPGCLISDERRRVGLPAVPSADEDLEYCKH